MSTWNFGNPTGAGDQWKAADHVGKLVAFVEPERKAVDTKFGHQEATACRFIVVFDDAGTGTVFDDPIVFGNISKDAFANGMEKIVLGRVAIGQAKAGQSPPYILEVATDADKAVAGAWFDANASTNAAGRILVNA